MLSRYVTSFVSNLLNRSPSFLRKIESRRFHSTSFTQQKKKGIASRFSKKRKLDGPKIIKPGNCAESPKPILDPSCKIAMVVGGCDGFGFAAADHLLCKGVQSIALVDNDCNQGETAVQMLCDSHGKNRAQFLQTDIKNFHQFEATLTQVHCKHKSIHIIFNDLDKDWFSTTTCHKNTEEKESTTAKVIHAGLQILRKDLGGPGGIIVNCGSIFGFLGWPEDPFPIYCKKQPTIEITMDFAEEFKVEETGVRLVALCPTNKTFSDIGLPDFPDPIPNRQVKKLPLCIPDTKHQIGSALSYVLAWAESGSAWLVEPATSVHEIPRLIHFPAKEGEKVDPKVYEAQRCSVKIEPPCVDTSKACSLKSSKTCKIKPQKKK